MVVDQLGPGYSGIQTNWKHTKVNYNRPPNPKDLQTYKAFVDWAFPKQSFRSPGRKPKLHRGINTYLMTTENRTKLYEIITDDIIRAKARKDLTTYIEKNGKTPPPIIEK